MGSSPLIDIIQDFKKISVQSGTIVICNLGQVDYIYKRPQERYILIDPYVTNSCLTRIRLG